MKQGSASNFAFIEPMMALQVGDLPVSNWLYELKFDGYRALPFKADKDLWLVSRNRQSFNNDYPELVDALKSLTAKQAAIDGEITALDQSGKSSFQLLQSYGKAKETPLVYFAFDLLLLEGADLRSVSLIERGKTAGHAAQKSSTQYPLFRGATWQEGRASPGGAAISARRFDRQNRILGTRAARRSGAWSKSN